MPGGITGEISIEMPGECPYILSPPTSTQDLHCSGNSYIHKSQHQDHDSPETSQFWFVSKGEYVSEWALFAKVRSIASGVRH